MSIQDLVSNDIDDIRQNMFDRLAAKQEEYIAAGWMPVRINLNKGIVRGLIELWCWGLYQLYLFLAVIFIQAVPDEATKLWLDLHCRQVGLARKSATKAAGTVHFTRTGTSGNVNIAAGRVVRTPVDASGNRYRYVTTAAAVLPDGATEIAVPVTAEEYGVAANATVGQISEVVTTIDGVDGVENRSGWLTSEGTDAEDDDSLRQRYQLAWKMLNGCTKYAYQAWALEVTGVVSATILDQHPRGEGTVDVLIVGSAGLPTQQLLDRVTANIMGTGAGDEKYPINDDVQIRAPEAVNVSFTGELELTGGTPALILAEAERRVRAQFSTIPVISDITPLEVGCDVTLDRLKTTIMAASANIKRINTTFTDITVPQDSLAVLSSLTLTYTWASES